MDFITGVSIIIWIMVIYQFIITPIAARVRSSAIFLDHVKFMDIDSFQKFLVTGKFQLPVLDSYQKCSININATFDNGDSLLDKKVLDNKLEFVHLLLRNGSRITERTIRYADQTNNLEIINLLKLYGGYCEYNPSILINEVKKGNVEKVKNLIAEGHNAHLIDRNYALHRNAMMVAIEEQNSEIVETFILNGYDLGATTSTHDKIERLFGDEYFYYFSSILGFAESNYNKDIIYTILQHKPPLYKDDDDIQLSYIKSKAEEKGDINIINLVEEYEEQMDDEEYEEQSN